MPHSAVRKLPWGRARSGARSVALVERGGAHVPQLAGAALGSAPDSIVDLLDAVEQAVVGGDEAELEVAPARPLGAQPRPCPVRAAEVEVSPVDDHGLEVHARA